MGPALWPRLDATYDTEKKMPEASLRRMQMETATKIAEKLPLKARAGQGWPGLARAGQGGWFCALQLGKKLAVSR